VSVVATLRQRSKKSVLEVICGSIYQVQLASFFNLQVIINLNES
jgi:hypothetical protein